MDVELMFKLKIIEKLKKLPNKEKEIELLQIEMYSMILGYYCAQRDLDLYKMYSDMNVINRYVDKLNKLFNTNDLFINIDDNNTMESFRKLIKNILQNDKENEDKYRKSLNSFIVGYEYYNKYKKKYNTMVDYSLSKKYKKLENKFNLVQNKIGM